MADVILPAHHPTRPAQSEEGSRAVWLAARTCRLNPMGQATSQSARHLRQCPSLSPPESAIRCRQLPLSRASFPPVHGSPFWSQSTVSHGNGWLPHWVDPEPVRDSLAPSVLCLEGGPGNGPRGLLSSKTAASDKRDGPRSHRRSKGRWAMLIDLDGQVNLASF